MRFTPPGKGTLARSAAVSDKTPASVYAQRSTKSANIYSLVPALNYCDGYRYISLSPPVAPAGGRPVLSRRMPAWAFCRCPVCHPRCQNTRILHLQLFLKYRAAITGAHLSGIGRFLPYAVPAGLLKLQQRAAPLFVLLCGLRFTAHPPVR